MQISVNRTKVELKQVLKVRSGSIRRTVNRTKVELKQFLD